MVIANQDNKFWPVLCNFRWVFYLFFPCCIFASILMCLLSNYQQHNSLDTDISLLTVIINTKQSHSFVSSPVIVPFYLELTLFHLLCVVLYCWLNSIKQMITYVLTCLIAVVRHFFHLWRYSLFYCVMMVNWKSKPSFTVNYRFKYYLRHQFFLILSRYLNEAY